MTPFIRASLAEDILFVILRVIFVSPLSRLDLHSTPSNFSPEVVEMEICRPLAQVRKVMFVNGVWLNKLWKPQE
jgi:hypothetical protein